MINYVRKPDDGKMGQNMSRTQSVQLFAAVFGGTFIQHDPLICTVCFKFHVYRPVYAVLTRANLFVGIDVLCMFLVCRLLLTYCSVLRMEAKPSSGISIVRPTLRHTS